MHVVQRGVCVESVSVSASVGETVCAPWCPERMALRADSRYDLRSAAADCPIARRRVKKKGAES